MYFILLHSSMSFDTCVYLCNYLYNHDREQPNFFKILPHAVPL